jgi:hypothetical protein
MNIWLTFATSLLSGLIGITVSTFYYRRYENRKMKLDLIRKLAGSRYQVAGGISTWGADSFFTSLNEVFVAFHDERKVIEAIDRLRRDLGHPGNIENNLPTLFKEMFKTVGLKNDYLNDSFILGPFTPPQKK